MYHLRVPAQFLEAGRIYLLEDNLHVAYVQLVHMLYLPLLAYGSTSGPALLRPFLLFYSAWRFSLLRVVSSRTNGRFQLDILWQPANLMAVWTTKRATFSYLAGFFPRETVAMCTCSEIVVRILNA